jgi:hypothetical protein
MANEARRRTDRRSRWRSPDAHRLRQLRRPDPREQCEHNLKRSEHARDGALPSSVNPKLRTNIVEGYENLADNAPNQCRSQSTHTSTGPTSKTGTTGKTGPTGPTSSTGPTESTSPIGPTGTTLGPGGGSQAPTGNSGTATTGSSGSSADSAGGAVSGV